MNPKIVFTGGGTAGHVTPNLALMEVLQKDDWEINYIGSDGVEKGMVRALNVPFHVISTGKLRRYFSWQNFLDPFKFFIGIGQSYRLLKKLKTDLVFSKGGFVGLPVVIAAWLNRIPVIAHESDLSPGLANRLSFPFIDKICLTFEGAKQHFKQQDKIEVTGTPIRPELFKGSKSKGLQLCGFNNDKPCLLVMGGSLGSLRLNKVLRATLPDLCEDYQIVHLCGKGNVDADLLSKANYYQFEYADKEMADLFAASDLIVSRAGANTLYEILALEKPHLLIPLPLSSSRGDQIQNARYFQQQGISRVLDDELLTTATFLQEINELNKQKEMLVEKMKQLKIESATLKIISLIKEQLDVESPKTV